MRAGRLVTSAGTRLVFAFNDKEVFDWTILDQDGVPETVRRAVEAAQRMPNNENFCGALPHMQEFLRNNPGFLRDRKQQALYCDPKSRFAPPVTPSNFVCIGLNYRDHAHEAGLKIPVEPLLFAKTLNALSGHNTPVRMPAGSTQIDYEAELTIVIGRPCHRVGKENALSCVAGYTCGNDVTARDFQFGDGQWYRGKSVDGFGPIGPWLVTPSGVGDPHRLRIQLRLNGKAMQDSNTSNLIFSVGEVVSYVSRNITLQSGDIIMTGTPPGVGFARKPRVWVKPGDVMEVDIENIGVLRNEVVEA
jgi:2-keto-4-pentenoate hydratase/2-oxohepta-3-ene-1,7-dioic acid hydratase in catechol pathway